MDRFHFKTLLPGLLCAALLFSGCQGSGGQSSSSGSAAPETDGTVQGGETDTAANTTAVIDTANLFSDRDLEGTWDESTVVAITLEGESASCDSSAVTIDGATITLTKEGTYLLSGVLTDGRIIVDAGDTDKVQIVLSGADITSSSFAAIYALEGDKVFLTLAEGTENRLANGGSYETIDENNVDAVVFAKTDLTLNGSGSLTIEAAAGHGVVSKDDLVVTGGSYTVTAESTGLTGKDSLSIAGGSFNITSGKDGLHAENTEDLSKGSLYIADGTFTIAAQGDAVSASGALQVDGGTFDLTTGEGSASVEMTSGDMGGFSPDGQRPERPQGNETGGETPPELPADGAEPPAGQPAEQDAPAQDQGTTADETEASDSQKGLKADGSLTLNGGSYTLDTVDDAIHAGGDLTITGGEYSLRSGDDAIHSDSAVTIRDGTFSIPYCYEGIEGLTVTVEGGTFEITSTDDGLNAAGGADSSGFGGFGGRGQDQFAADGDSFISISGGKFTIVSNGDCIDSNGDLTISGGTLDLTCNSAGNTALDADGSYTNTGGAVTTNDGSEDNAGGFGGQPGGRENDLNRGENPPGAAGAQGAPETAVLEDDA